MNQASFNTLIVTLRPKLYRFSLSLLKQPEAAEDVVQEVGARLWQNLARGQEHPHMEALAMCTAKNLCIDQLRRHKRHPFSSLSQTLVQPSTQQTPQKILEEKDLTAHIRQLIEQLPLQQQMCIRLRDIEGYEFDEIARVLDCDESTVRVNLSRARKKIREQIIQDHGE